VLREHEISLERRRSWCDGLTNKEAAGRLATRPATVSKWRGRFARHGLAGVADAPRSGKPRHYDAQDERRILGALDGPPPAGYARWNGPLHFTPTHASWLNQVEVWFSILSSHALAGASFTSPRQVREQIDAFITAYNQDAHPFEWTKQVVFSKHPRSSYANLRN